MIPSKNILAVGWEYSISLSELCKSSNTVKWIGDGGGQ